MHVVQWLTDLANRGLADWMTKCLVICFIVSGIHAYYGLHVIARKVIFVDLALAQIAALGATYALFIGAEGEMPVYVFSIIFTFIGAAIFALTRTRKDRIPHEAIIGVTYVVAGAFAIVMVYLIPTFNPSNPEAAHGAEHIRDILTGHMLTATPASVLLAAAVYAGLAGFHYALRSRFVVISLDPEKAEAQGIRIGAWDLLFYMTFGVLVSISVRLVGVLLVFSFLVVPAIIAFVLATTLRARIIVGWASGFVVSAIGVVVAFHPPSYGGEALKLPMGPFIASLFGLVLVAVGLIQFTRTAESWKTVARTYAGLAGIGGVMVALFFLGGVWGPEDHTHGHEEHARGSHDRDLLIADLYAGDPSERRAAVSGLAPLVAADRDVVAALTRHAERESAADVRRAIYEALAASPTPDVRQFLVQRFDDERTDPALELAIARALDAAGSVDGVRLRIEILAGVSLDVAPEALADLTLLSGGDAFGYDPAALLPDEAAVSRWRAWFDSAKDRLVWDRAERRFVLPAEAPAGR